MPRISIFATLLLAMAGNALADPAAPPPQDRRQDQAAQQPGTVCPQETGSRIKRQTGDCGTSPGSSYGSDELRLTGATDVGQGLRQMDPRLTVTGH